jgi:hypothetical protein
VAAMYTRGQTLASRSKTRSAGAKEEQKRARDDRGVAGTRERGNAFEWGESGSRGSSVEGLRDHGVMGPLDSGCFNNNLVQSPKRPK